MGGVTFAGQLTKFEVNGVLKGKLAERTLDLVHYTATVTGEVIGPGVKVSYARAYVAEFPETKAPSEDDATRKGEGGGNQHYLLFLKRRKDGKFEPVSGQVDSACSVMLLKPEGPASWHREDISERSAR